MTDFPILAIDYGEKHFGLAYSDKNGIVATPLEVLSLTKRKTYDDIAEEIEAICEEYKIKTILLGTPQIFEKSQAKTISKISNFETILRNHTTLPVVHTDESFSTIEAQNMLLSTGQNIKSTRKKIDKVSAAIFLQEFLNSENQ